MSTGEGSFAATQQDEPRFETLPERRFAVRPHPGTEEDVDATRRPVYQHMILHELVAGPSVLRFRSDGIDVMVGCAAGFMGMEDLSLEVIPAGRFAVMDYEGPANQIADARGQLMDWVATQGAEPTGPMLQVHMMDPMDDGMVEQQLQIPVAS